MCLAAKQHQKRSTQKEGFDCGGAAVSFGVLGRVLRNRLDCATVCTTSDSQFGFHVLPRTSRVGQTRIKPGESKKIVLTSTVLNLLATVAILERQPILVMVS